MASCQTAQWVSTAPYVTLTVTSSTYATYVTLTWKLTYTASSAASTSVAKSYTVTMNGTIQKSGTYNINNKTGTVTIASGTLTINKTTLHQTISFGVSFAFNLTWSGSYAGTKSASGSIPVTALDSYTVKYSANGGSGAPSTQIKWYGTPIALSSTKPTRTGYTFSGWATEANGSVKYAAGATYSTNASVALYAVWTAYTYTVTYNANGGSGAPASQIKTYGVALTLSTTIPTRTGYVFKGWATSASATTLAYPPGGTYSNNTAVTLYAVWESTYVAPKITGISVYRCDSDGTSSNSGTYARVIFNWSTTNSITSCIFNLYTADKTTNEQYNMVVSGTSGSMDAHWIGMGSLDVETSYTLQIVISDSEGSTTVQRTIPSMVLPIDIKSGGTGIAFGKVAEDEGILDTPWEIRSVHDDLGIWHKHTSTGQLMAFGSGSSGVNRGIWDGTLNKWLRYWNDTDIYDYVPRTGTHYFPYYKAGDTIIVYTRTAGYVTNSSTEVHFTIPLAKPILGGPTVSGITNSGYILRQNGVYTHGSGASTYCRPSTTSCSLYTGTTSSISSTGHNMVAVILTFSDTTNAINNSPVGIYASFNIVLS